MPRKMREMVGGCCVCSDESGWDENPLVYCDGQGCNVAVHQACYGIVTVPTGPWFCRKCESQERSARVRCELCPNKDGALKRTDTNSWAHVVCALYIPEVRFGNVATMEPIVLGLVPADRYLKTCYLCEQQGRESRASTGACMPCNRAGCKQTFHVTCAQGAGLLCEEAGNYMDNVRYCGYCEYHYQRINKKAIKTIPAFKPLPSASAVDSSDEDAHAEASLSPSKSPKESSGLNSSSSSAATQAAGSATQGRNSSMSTSSSSSKKGKKGRRNNQGVSSSSTTGSPKSDNEKSVPPPASPASTTSSIILKRSQSEDVADLKKPSNDDTQPLSSPSTLTLATTTTTTKNSTTEKDCSKPGTISSSGSAGGSASGSGDKNNDVSSSGAEEKTEKKPPSVIVKFGKQDGTYYSKKQDSLTSLTISNKKEKEKNHKHTGDNGSNSVGANSSASISTIPIAKREIKDSSEAKSNNSSAGSISSTNQANQVGQNSSKDVDRKSMNSGGGTDATLSKAQRRAGVNDINPSSASSLFPNDDKKDAGNESKSEAVEKVSVKVEPVDNSVDLTKKVPPVSISGDRIIGSTDAGLNHKSPSSSKAMTSSSTSSTSSSLTVTLDKSKLDLKDGKSGPGMNQGHPGFGRVGAGKTEPDRPTPSGLTIEKSFSSPTTSSSSSTTATSSTASTLKDSPAKIIPLLPSVTVTSSNFVKVDLKSSPLSLTTNKKPEAPTPMDTSSSTLPPRNDRAGTPPRINTELLSGTNDSKSGLGPKRTASGKRLGRPPKKGTHLQSDSLGPMASAGSTEKLDKDVSPDRSSTSGDAKRRKQSPGSRLSNGGDTSSLWMMGATLNPNSSVAKEMDACLKDEIQTHAAYDPSHRSALHGVPFPGAKRNSNPKPGPSSSSSLGGAAEIVNKGPHQQPQTLEELLERQWEQGSQFLMEQASHFDIASLLSSLHQLKEENLDLEDSVDRLVQRRDHLLAVRARLMALSSLATSPQNSTQTTPERSTAASASASMHHTNGPSPASGRSSTHVSPRNSAATVSPIRVDRSSTSAATIISPRNLPPPPPGGSSLMSPRDRTGASLPPPPPSSHHMHQLPSPRDRVPVDRGGPGMPPMENGIDFHPPPPSSQQHPGAPNAFISSSSQQSLQNRAQIYSNSRGVGGNAVSGNNLLTVVSSANSGMHPGASSGQHNHGAVMQQHHRPMGHLPPSGHGPSPHSPHVQTPPPNSAGQPPQPPPRQSAYPNASMHGSSLQPPPPSHAASSRPGVHMGHPSHGLPPPPGSMMRPPMSHPHDLRPPHSFPSGYHPMSSGPRGPPPPHAPPPSHGPPRSTASMMAMAQHMRSSNVLDKR